jgi:hypothetical protein
MIIASAHADTWVYDDITADTTWTPAGSPYNISGTIMIVNGAILTIQPNVDVVFYNHAIEYSALVIENSGTRGAIVAHGTAGNEIAFWSTDPGIHGSIASRIVHPWATDPPKYDFRFEYCVFSNIKSIGFTWNGNGNGGIRAVNCRFASTRVKGPNYQIVPPIYDSRIISCDFLGEPVVYPYLHALTMTRGYVEECTFDEMESGCSAQCTEITASTFTYCETALAIGKNVATSLNTFEDNDVGVYVAYSSSIGDGPWSSDEDTFYNNVRGIYIDGYDAPANADYSTITGATITYNDWGIDVWGTGPLLKIRDSGIGYNRIDGIRLFCDHNAVDLGTALDPGGNTIVYNGDNDPEHYEYKDIYAHGSMFAGTGLIPAVGNTWEHISEAVIELCDITDYNDDPSNYTLDVRVTAGDTDFATPPLVITPIPKKDTGVPTPSDEGAPTAPGGAASATNGSVSTNDVGVEPTSLGNIKAIYQ